MRLRNRGRFNLQANCDLRRDGGWLDDCSPALQVHRVEPPQKPRHTREASGIRLDARGRWWHDGELIEHPRIIEAFNRGISPAEDGKFRLQFGNDWCIVDVEGAAYRVQAIDLAPEDRLSIRLSDRTAEFLDPRTLRLDPDGVLTCRVKRGVATARFSREAQFALGSLLEDVEGRLVLRVNARSYPVPLDLK